MIQMTSDTNSQKSSKDCFPLWSVKSTVPHASGDIKCRMMNDCAKPS